MVTIARMKEFIHSFIHSFILTSVMIFISYRIAKNVFVFFPVFQRLKYLIPDFLNTFYWILLHSF